MRISRAFDRFSPVDARDVLVGLAVLAACSMGRGNVQPAQGGVAGAPGYVKLERAAHPLAVPELDAGRLDGAKVLPKMSLVFKLTAEQKADRDALLTEIQRPGSPIYHHWLEPEEYAARFGASEETLARSAAWLASQGLTVLEPSSLGTRITFTGTVDQVESAFRTELHAYDVHGERHFAMARPPSVPAEIADRVLGIVNTHDFYPHHSKTQFRVVPQPDATCPGGDPYCNGNAIAPPDWAFIYDVNWLYNPGIGGTLITGAGVTVAVVGITDISQTDLNAFRTRYGLPVNNITKTIVPNTGAVQAANGAGAEAVLDVEWAGAIAPLATINYVYTGAADQNVNDAVFYAIEQNYGGVLSVSWGGCEMGLAPADADAEEVYGAAAALEGISFLAAAGDDGAADCGGKGGLWVNVPAALPQVTAVGGTGFTNPGGLTFGAGGIVSAVGTETAWNEANNPYLGTVSAGGGGISAIYARPLYQSGVATCAPIGSLPTPVNPASQRQLPDVSFTAATGATQYGIFMECTLDSGAGDCTNTGASPVVLEVGGTSASTPAFAGVVALADQATGGRLGNINPLLYSTHTSMPTAFHDITAGNNEVVCHTADTGCPGTNSHYGYAATAGYDCATGLGSIDAKNLVTAWAMQTPTTTSFGAIPSSTTEGGSVTLTATIDVNGVNAHALSRDVSLVFRSYLANHVLDTSWSLGDVAIANGTTTSGSVILSTTIPPGMVKPSQSVDVFALYSGDANHLPSFSTPQNITFGPVPLCVSPPTASVAVGATVNYTAGGVAPIRWYIVFDSTCSPTFTGCSNINVTTGAFTAGTGAHGYVIVQAIDADGADTFSEVTVGGGAGTVPWSASGPSNYAGILPGGNPPAEIDGGVRVAQSAGSSVISWNLAQGATSSDILRGLVSGLPVGPGGGDEVCLANVSSPTNTFTDSASPGAGSSFWYLVRGNNACGHGAWGAQSNGTPSVSTTCP